MSPLRSALPISLAQILRIPSLLFFALVWARTNPAAAQAADAPARGTLVRVVDLDVDEAQQLELADRSRVQVKLLRVEEKRDPLRQAVRQGRVTVEVNRDSPDHRHDRRG